MIKSSFHKFFFSIVAPSLLAISLFIVSIYAVIIPSFEKNILERKKEMISELTNTAWSLIKEYHDDYLKKILTCEEAQQAAASRIEKLRYGQERKDYFWITDMQPVMIMHPYRPDLNGTDLNNYIDPNGKKLFVEAVNVVTKQEQGYINYQWQWKDDSLRIVPKLSYVKGFKEWGWILGTGIYLEDVKNEISILKNRLLRISSIIIAIIVITLLYVIKQSLRIEKERTEAEEKLKLSRQKYKTLVDASTEGTLMIIGHKIIFANQKFKQMSGYSADDLLKMNFEDVFGIKWKDLISKFEDVDKSVTVETQLKCGNQSGKDIVISVSRVKHDNNNGYIIIVKDVTGKKLLEIEKGQLSFELQSSLLLMNQPIRSFIQEIYKCNINTKIEDAVKLMIRKNQKALFVEHDHEIVGIINDSDLKKRVLAMGMDKNSPISGIMSSPIISISNNALLYEALLILRKNNISHVAVKNNQGKITGVLNSETIYEMQHNLVSFLIKEIEITENAGKLKKIYGKVPVLINALIETGDKAQNITRIITSVSDSISKRLIELSFEQYGPPPCRFAFIVMGSEGRMEQTLKTDQDNSIIFENLEPQFVEKSYQYFQKIGEYVCDNLNNIGFRYCEGEIMAKNLKWTQPLSVWKEYFQDWITSGDPQSILDSSIFFDFRCIYGSTKLTDELRGHINEISENKAAFLYHLTQSVLKFKPPVGTFGNIVSSQDSKILKTIDVKKILMPVTGFVRIYALKNTINETNTLLRIEKLYSEGVINKNMYDNLVLSYNYLMISRFKSQVSQVLNNNQPDNYLDINELTEIERVTLKKIFSEISNLQTKLSFDFKGSF